MRDGGCPTWGAGFLLTQCIQGFRRFTLHILEQISIWEHGSICWVSRVVESPEMRHPVAGRKIRKEAMEEDPIVPMFPRPYPFPLPLVGWSYIAQGQHSVVEHSPSIQGRETMNFYWVTALRQEYCWRPELENEWDVPKSMHLVVDADLQWRILMSMHSYIGDPVWWDGMGKKCLTSSMLPPTKTLSEYAKYSRTGPLSQPPVTNAYQNWYLL